MAARPQACHPVAMELLEAADYQPELQRRFQRLQAWLQACLPGGWSLSHVGSSAIPGAISKGDLDVCLLVPPDAHAAWVARLEALGYVVKVDTLRTPELCMLEMHEPHGTHGTHEPYGKHGASEHAVQLVAQGSVFEDFLRFRDRLSADPALVQAYNQVKRQAARLDEDGYRAAKSAFIESVLAQR